MAIECCNLVGNFPTTGLPDGCVISISVSSRSEISKVESAFIVGPTIGTVSISAYADNRVYSGCPAKATISIDWMRRLDCDTILPGGGKGGVHFIYKNNGSSSMEGIKDTDFDIRFEHKAREFRVIDANSSSGPAALYTDDIREEGYGLIYDGEPISFDTSDPDSLIFYASTGLFTGLLDFHPFYLQNFSFDASPGQFPKASYSFLFVITT